jgi:hypothetical protein
MSQKKTLEEQGSSLSKGKNTWLEPMKNWILQAKSPGKVAESSLLTEKRVLAQ